MESDSSPNPYASPIASPAASPKQPPPKPASVPRTQSVIRHERLVLLVLAAVQFTNIVDFMFIMPLGPRLMPALGIDPTQFGRVVSAYAFAAGIAGLIAAAFIDRWGRKTAFLSLYVGFLAGTLLCGLAPSYPTLVAARIVTGMFGGVLGGLAMAIIGDVFPDERRGAATGALMSAFALASVVGVPFGLELGMRLDWHAPFLVLAALGVPVLGIAVWAMPPLGDHLTGGVQQRSLAKIAETLFHPPHLRAFALIVMLMFGAFAVIPYISSYLVANVGVETSELKYIFIVGGACALVSSPIIGRLADRFGKLRVYRIMAPMSAAMMLVITTLPRAGLLVAIAAVSGLMISNSGRMVAAMAMINGAVEPRRRGGFMTANSSLQHMATGLGAYVGGSIIVEASDGSWQRYGVAGLVGATATLITLWLAGRLRPAEPSQGADGGTTAEPTSVTMSLEAAAEASVDFEPMLQVAPRKSVA